MRTNVINKAGSLWNKDHDTSGLGCLRLMIVTASGFWRDPRWGSDSSVGVGQDPLARVFFRNSEHQPSVEKHDPGA